jgi:hypothetical protein
LSGRNREIDHGGIAIIVLRHGAQPTLQVHKKIEDLKEWLGNEER